MSRSAAAHNRSLDRVNTIAPACDAAQPQAARSRPDTDARPIELAMWRCPAPSDPSHTTGACASATWLTRTPPDRRREKVERHRNMWAPRQRRSCSFEQPTSVLPVLAGTADDTWRLTPKLSDARHGCRTPKALYLSDFTHLPSPKPPRACAAACC
jgi:hypothetical protein